MVKKFPNWSPKILIDDFVHRKAALNLKDEEIQILINENLDQFKPPSDQMSYHSDTMSLITLYRLLTNPHMQYAWRTLRTKARDAYKPTKTEKILYPDYSNEDIFCMFLASFILDPTFFKPGHWDKETPTQNQDRLNKIINHLQDASKLLRFSPRDYPFNITSGMNIDMLEQLLKYIDKSKYDELTESYERLLEERDVEDYEFLKFDHYSSLIDSIRNKIDTPILSYTLENMANSIKAYGYQTRLKSPNAKHSNERYFVLLLSHILFRYLENHCYGTTATITNTVFNNSDRTWDKYLVKDVVKGEKKQMKPIEIFTPL